MSQIFISYARKDHFFVDRLREDLARAGIPYWIDREGLSPGTPSWERAIRAALKASESVLWIVSPASFESPFVRDEISIAKLYKCKIYPIFAAGEQWLECVPLGMGEIQYIDARSDYKQAFSTILNSLGRASYVMPEERTPTLPAQVEPRNPYKGLAAFTEKDAGDFYGREALVNKLLARLDGMLAEKLDRFLAVLGPSGAGKSSVVMAGLIPALRKAHPQWVFLRTMVPGRHPVEALADVLYSAMPEKSLSALESDLNSPGGRMLARLSHQIEAPHIVLYIDQFEELFTLTESEEERQHFISLITQAASEPDGRLTILISMRADFYGHPMNYPQLGTLVEANNVGILPMSITELRDAIEKPARLPDVALTFEDGLVAEIIFALRERDKALAGALPLLQFTLERLFAERRGTHLTFEAYDVIGGVQGAIGTHCEAVFSSLPEAVQAKLGQVFLPLVNIDEESGEPTRRRAPLAAVLLDPDAETLVNALVNHGLLQRGREGTDRYIEITHEALFHKWERLVSWIEKTRANLRLLRQIEREAADWDKDGRRYLLTAERLQPIHAAVVQLGYKVGPIFHDFVYPQKMLLAELENPATSEQRRLRIGDDLGLLGDTRYGVGVRDGVPEICWLPVDGSGGKFKFEFGEFEVKPFCVSKYLTTYQQFQAFVEAEDGYNNLEWWRDMSVQYQRQNLKEQRTQSRNNPRDSLSWYQSVAFARWMNQRLQGVEVPHPAGVLRVGENAEIRLPTEWEWQWAAQCGYEAREHPWGAWQRGCANTGESGLGRAIAVGMYPHGVAACGALDMSGNLWEWCLNEHEKPEQVKVNSSGNRRELRGGAFNDTNAQHYAACAYRYGLNPRYFDLSYGCRLVVGSAPMP